MSCMEKKPTMYRRHVIKYEVKLGNSNAMPDTCITQGSLLAGGVFRCPQLSFLLLDISSVLYLHVSTVTFVISIMRPSPHIWFPITLPRFYLEGRVPSPALLAIQDVFAGGAVVGGSSAGMVATVSAPMITGNSSLSVSSTKHSQIYTPTPLNI